MTEQTTALAPAPDALPAKPEKPTRSLIADLAEQAGIDPGNFLAAVKVAAGCKGATNEHFMVLLMQAQRYNLDPLSSPPMLQLLDVGQGPQVYARLDAYKAFLHRAEAAGKIEWRRYEEGWFPDPQCPPEKLPRPTARGGKVTMKLKGHPEPIEKIVWLREWGGKGQWSTRASHMLEARAWKEACRDWLGFFVYDTDDAERIQGDTPRQVSAEVRDSERADPIVAIPSLRRPGAAAFAPPPPSLEEPQTEPSVPPAGSPSLAEGGVALTGGGTSEPDASPVAKSAAPRASLFPEAPGELSAAENLALDREIAAEQARAEEGR